MAEATAASAWSLRLKPYQQSCNRRALGELIVTLGSLSLVWLLMLRAHDLDVYWVSLLLAPLGGLLLMRVFVLQHDCGHGSFFTSKAWNDRVGSLLGVLTLTPYDYWRRTHSIHHSASGNLDRRDFGDIDTFTVAEYQALSAWGRLGYRIYRHPAFLFLLAPVLQFFVKHRYPSDAPDTWRKEWRSVRWTNLGLIALVGGMAWALGPARFLAVTLPLPMIGAPLGIWLFYVQHQFEGAYWRRDQDWDYYQAALMGSSFYDLPGILHWFTANIGLHHIHHLDSRIPSYRLQACLAGVPELDEVPRLSMWQSLRCMGLKLWDEDAGRLVGFRGLPARREVMDEVGELVSAATEERDAVSQGPTR